MFFYFAQYVFVIIHRNLVLHHVLYKCSEFYLIRSVILLYKTCSFKSEDQMSDSPSGITNAVKAAREIIDLLKKHCDSFYDQHLVLFERIENDKSSDYLLETNGNFTIPKEYKDMARYPTAQTLSSVVYDLKKFDNLISKFLKENQPSYSLNCCSKPSLISQVNLTQIKSLLVACQNGYKNSTDFSQA